MSDFEFSTPTETKLKRGRAAAASQSAPLPRPEPQTPAPEASGEAEATAKTDQPAYDPEELSRIFDEIIFSGEYTEGVTIRGKLRIGLRTRAAGEIEQISLVADGMSANLISTLAEKRALLNLVYALTSFQGKDLVSLSTEDRSKFVKGLPGPIIGVLLDALGKFDAKVYEACKDAEANF